MTSQPEMRLEVRMGPTNLQRLAAISKKLGVSRGQVIRLLIDEKHSQLFGSQVQEWKEWGKVQ